MSDPTPESQPETYTLSLNTTQAKALLRALDLYSRVGMRQLEAIGAVMTFELARSLESIETVQAVRHGLNALKQTLGFQSGESLDIRSAPRLARIAYDIQQVLRFKVGEVENLHGSSVWRVKPYPTADLALATCTVGPVAPPAGLQLNLNTMVRAVLTPTGAAAVTAFDEALGVPAKVVRRPKAGEVWEVELWHFAQVLGGMPGVLYNGAVPAVEGNRVEVVVPIEISPPVAPESSSPPEPTP